jgi:hypothetical protein
VNHVLSCTVRLDILYQAERGPIHTAWMAGYKFSPATLYPVLC